MGLLTSGDLIKERKMLAMYPATWVSEFIPDAGKLTPKRGHRSVTWDFSLEAFDILSLLCVFSVLTTFLVWSLWCSVCFSNLHPMCLSIMCLFILFLCGWRSRVQNPLPHNISMSGVSKQQISPALTL